MGFWIKIFSGFVTDCFFRLKDTNKIYYNRRFEKGISE